MIWKGLNAYGMKGVHPGLYEKFAWFVRLQSAQNADSWNTKKCIRVLVMKVVILAGGMGSRIGEETKTKPKPMIEIGGRPILWHIMNLYSHYGFHEFVICCGYMGQVIKDYFVHYYLYQADSTFYLNSWKMDYHEVAAEPWKVTLVNTGLNTLTAGRILRVRKYIGSETFLLTYGDGVADVDISSLIRLHRQQGRIVTITAVQPLGRFGGVQIDPEACQVLRFKEKARADQAWVNAGFMVMEPEIFEYLEDGSEMLEGKPFEQLAARGQMSAYRHMGFWSPMDNMRDKAYLEELWESGKAPWRIWENKCL